MKNTGNAKDETIKLEVGSHPDQWSVILDTSNIPPEGLEKKVQVTIKGIFLIPSEIIQVLPKGVYDIKIIGYAGTPLEIKDELIIKVNILQTIGAEFSCETPIKKLFSLTSIFSKFIEITCVIVSTLSGESI